MATLGQYSWAHIASAMRLIALFATVRIFIATGAHAATIALSGPTNYAVGSHPVAVAIGDFNGDGKSDLAVANSSSNDVSILLGNGDGTFQAAGNYSVESPAFVAVGDFNGDNRLDLGLAFL